MLTASGNVFLRAETYSCLFLPLRKELTNVCAKCYKVLHDDWLVVDEYMVLVRFWEPVTPQLIIEPGMLLKLN